MLLTFALKNNKIKHSTMVMHVYLINNKPYVMLGYVMLCEYFQSGYLLNIIFAFTKKKMIMEKT